MDANCANNINRLNYQVCKLINKKHNKNKKEIFDIIIGGGGIAGMNSIYELLKYNPNLKMILFEKNNKLGGRIKREFFDNQPVDMGAVRIPKDFTLTPNLALELGLKLRTFTTELKATFTREKWFPRTELNKSQERYFLPENTPPQLNQQELLFNTLLELVGTLDFNDLDPNKLVNGIPLIRWGIFDLLKIKLTSEEIEWISNSLNFSFYKTDVNAYEWCIHNFHSSEYFLIDSNLPNGPKFGNMFKLIERLNEETNKINKLVNHEIKSANYNDKTKLWTIEVLNTINNTRKNYFSKKFLSTIPNFYLKNININVPNLELWNILLNCNVPFPLSRVYVKYPNNWWSSIYTEGSVFDESTNKMIWIMDKDSNILLGSYSDEFQCNYWAGLPNEKILDQIHLGICRGFNVNPESVPKPLSYKKKNWTNPEYPVYWYKKGINGSNIQNIAKKPFNNYPLYIASETLSNRVGWIEGALSASYETITQIIKDF
jgi:hypothetical protein